MSVIWLQKRARNEISISELASILFLGLGKRTKFNTLNPVIIAMCTDLMKYSRFRETCNIMLAHGIDEARATFKLNLVFSCPLAQRTIIITAPYY